MPPTIAKGGEWWLFVHNAKGKRNLGFQAMIHAMSMQQTDLSSMKLIPAGLAKELVRFRSLLLLCIKHVAVRPRRRRREDFNSQSQRRWMMGLNLKADRIYCDGCGRFMNPNQPGSSWAHVPASDISYEENIEYCPTCTKRHGRPIPMQSVNLDVCTGFIAQSDLRQEAERMVEGLPNNQLVE